MYKKQLVNLAVFFVKKLLPKIEIFTIYGTVAQKFFFRKFLKIFLDLIIP